MQTLFKGLLIICLSSTLLCGCNKDEWLWNTGDINKIQKKEWKNDMEQQRKEHGSFTSWVCQAYGPDQQVFRYSSASKQNASRTAAAMCKSSNHDKPCQRISCHQREF